MLLPGETSLRAGGFSAGRFVVFFKHTLAYFISTLAEKITTQLPGIL